MKKQIFLTFLAAAMTAMITIQAQAQVKTHSIWTNDNGLVIGDAETGCEYSSLAAFDMATSWTQPTPGYAAQAHFRGVSKAYAYSPLCNTDHFYEFTLIKTASTSSDDIVGVWNVYRDGSLVCSLCDGSAYGLGQSTGLYYKVVINDAISGIWYYIGYIDQRKDF